MLRKIDVMRNRRYRLLLLGGAEEAEPTRLVAVASSGTNRVMYSDDGLTWTAAAAAVANSWSSVFWGNDRYVAVASSGGTSACMTSPDGIIWTGRTITSAAWRGVTYSPDLDLWVAVGDTAGPTSVISTSDDGGVTWTPQTVPSIGSMNCVIWVPWLALFVAGSGTNATNRIVTSPDGVEWTQQTTASLGFRRLAHNNDDRVIGCSPVDDKINHSDNATAWTQVDIAGLTDVRGVACDPLTGRFAVVLPATGASRAFTSDDKGATWTGRTLAARDWTDVVWSAAHGLYVAVCNSGVGQRVATSPDGVTWTQQTTPEDNSWQAVCTQN